MPGMRKKVSDWIEQYRCMDWALLYLRLFAGGMLVLHNIGKIQHYNELIGSYPSVLYIDNSAVFVAVTVVEVLLAVMIMAGIYVRLSAAVLVLGIVAVIAGYGFGYVPSAVAWLGVYSFFAIAGGGYYALDVFLDAAASEK